MEKIENFIKNMAELPTISGEEFKYIRKIAKIYHSEVALIEIYTKIYSIDKKNWRKFYQLIIYKKNIDLL